MNEMSKPVTAVSPATLARLIAVVGEKTAITDKDKQTPYLVEFRPLWTGRTAALAHGIARSHALGLEVVLPDGRIMNNLNKLKKDNTGYDLRDLFIGAEGTLGVITAASLRLVPRPRSIETAWAAIPSVQAA